MAGNERSGDKPGHEFHGNQYGYGRAAPKTSTPPMPKFEKNSTYAFLEKEGETREDNDRIAGEKWGLRSNRMNPISNEEHVDVYNSYSGTPHSWVLNDYMRTGEYDALVFDPEKMKITINNIKNAIDKQPPMPKGEELWRGVKDEFAEHAKTLVVGDKVADNGFTSTTYNLRHAQSFTDSSRFDVLYRIITSGKEKAIPGHEEESEMIFQAGQKWEVIGIEDHFVDYIDPDLGYKHPDDTRPSNRYRIITVTGID